MNTHTNIRLHIRRHDRNIALFGRLLAEWNKGQFRRSIDARQRLDAIEVQLARLERVVTMDVPVVTPARPAPNCPDSRRATVPLAAQTT